MNNKRLFSNSAQPGSQNGQLHIRAGGFSVTGTRHVVNQDRYLIDQQRGSYIVADGMGGMRAGEHAAQMAVDLLPNHPALLALELPQTETMRKVLVQSFFDVSSEIESAGNLDSRLKGMGTSVVMAQQVGNLFFLASLGDSRAYLQRDGSLRQYTIDHNITQALVNMGAIDRNAARLHRWRNMLWKYLGAPDLNEGPDVVAICLEPGDQLLLTSDGVTGVLARQEMQETLDSHKSPAEAARSLVHAAVARGTRDDATSVVIYVDP